MRMRLMIIPLLIGLGLHGQYFEWTPLPPFPGTARDDASAFTIGNTVYVGTGRDVVFALRNDWHAFDMIEETWSPIATMPASGRQYCAAFSDGNYGYVFGGVDGEGPLNELWRYDPVLDGWTLMAPLPAPGRYATVAFNNGMVCTGLLEGGAATNECWRYDTATDSWSAGPPVPGLARHRAAGSGDQVFVVGGRNGAGEVLDDVQVYDPTSGSWWTSSSPLPAARFGADAVYHNVLGSIFLVGGASSDNAFHDDCWSGGPWSPNAPFAGGPRRGGVIAYGAPLGVVQNVYYGTGVDDTQRYGDWWVYQNLSESIREGDPAVMRIHPNPSAGVIHLELGATLDRLPYWIHDVTGRVVATGIHTPGIPLDLSEQPPGLYHVIVSGPVVSHRGRVIISPHP
ncbi:MAG: kelch repeat-containing protein [Flavobacteriales bacterium]